MSDPEWLQQEAERAELRAQRLRERAENLPERPLEPEPFEDGTCLVMFSKQFEGSVRQSYVYHYAAVRTPQGHWFVTGRINNTPAKGRDWTWDEVVAHIYDRAHS